MFLDTNQYVFMRKIQPKLRTKILSSTECRAYEGGKTTKNFFECRSPISSRMDVNFGSSL